MASLLPLVVLFLAVAATAAGGLCPASCGMIDISYPFGVGPACSLPGFNLTCKSNTYNDQLWLGSPNVSVDMTVSASGSITALAAHVVRSVNMPAAATAYSVSWEGPGRPFAISGSSNMSLFVVGCGVLAALLDGGTGAVVGNCSVICAGEEVVMERLPDGLCGGVGCCRIDVRVPLRAFVLNLSRTGEGVTRDRVTFLVTGPDGYTFRASDLEQGIVAGEAAPALLDWAIPDPADCALAAADGASYACVSNNSESASARTRRLVATSATAPRVSSATPTSSVAACQTKSTVQDSPRRIVRRRAGTWTSRSPSAWSWVALQGSISTWHATRGQLLPSSR